MTSAAVGDTRTTSQVDAADFGLSFWCCCGCGLFVVVAKWENNQTMVDAGFLKLAALWFGPRFELGTVCRSDLLVRRPW